MIFRTHEDLDINIDNTHLQDCLDISFDDLVTCFGIPMIGNCSAVRVEWKILFEDGVVATIYDWKQVVPVNSNRRWNVGGHDKRAVERVIDTIAEKLANGFNKRIINRLDAKVA